MKIWMFPAVAVMVFATSLMAGEDAWMTDHAKALEQAKADKKMVVMDFTGSDWCGWCIKLDKEIFSQKEFKEYADKNLVLLKLDFPHRTKLAAALAEQNEKLMQQYQVEGFPTVIVLNSEGKQIGQLGYMEGGPAAFVGALEQLKKK